MKRICKKCNHTIRRTERWKHVYTKFLWFLTRKHVEHHNCSHPCDGPVKTVKRMAGEVPLPFPDTVSWNDSVSGGLQEGTTMGYQITPAQELERID
jgi:hypothetical protein